MSVIISYLLQKSIVVTMNENRRNTLGIIRREGIRFLSYLASTLVVSSVIRSVTVLMTIMVYLEDCHDITLSLRVKKSTFRYRFNI